MTTHRCADTDFRCRYDDADGVERCAYAAREPDGECPFCCAPVKVYADGRMDLADGGRCWECGRRIDS